jgi:glucokinase
VPDQRKNTDKLVAIGIEITGSRATVALVDHHGRIRQRRYAKTLRGRPAAATLEPYIRALELLLMYAKSEGLLVNGLGISIPGTLDLSMRRPLTLPSLPSLNDFPLCDLIEARYNLPVHLQVDVDAALLGEYHFGVGKGFRRLLFLNINAVVGAALVVNGKLESSAQEYLGHVSHMPVSMRGPRCSCGKYGCINRLISTEALQKKVQRALSRGQPSSLVQRLSNREQFSPKLLAEEALRGDAVSLQVFNEVGRWLGAATAKYIDKYELDILILGGGALCTDELLIAKVRHVLMTQALSKTYKVIQIVPSFLGSDAALIGTVAPFLYEDAL